MSSPSSPELSPPTSRPTRLRPFADTSLSTLVAGFVAMMTGYTSSLVLMFQAGQAAHLSDAQISSWIWALSIGMALCTIGLSLRFRAPIVIAWSTPGAALLVSSLPHVAYPQAIGAFIVCALLLTVVGLTGWFDTLMKRFRPESPRRCWPASCSRSASKFFEPRNSRPRWCWRCSSPTSSSSASRPAMRS